MLQFTNNTPFVFHSGLFNNIAGVETLFIYLKGTFDLAGSLLPPEQQTPIRELDEYHGEPLRSSLRAPSDFTLGKPGTDVLLNASAQAPEGKPAPFVDVVLRVGEVINKTVRVFGKRVWERHFLLLKPSEPEPFAVAPLCWENAFGGGDEEPASGKTDAPAHREEDPRNPIGRGFRAKGNTCESAYLGVPLPRQESPQALLQRWKDRPSPAGFGALCAHWQPRRAYVGTYDAAWQNARAPFLPADFDARFFNTAPAGQIVAPHLSGGEPVSITGASAEPRLAFTVPAVRPVATFTVGTDDTPVPLNLETLLIDLDARVLTLAWACQFTHLPRIRDVREIKIETNFPR
jgi:hypothetical protein